MNDRNWRLSNLYYVTDDNGNRRKLILNESQRRIMDNIERK